MRVKSIKKKDLGIVISLTILSILVLLAGFGYFGEAVEEFVKDWFYNLWRFRFLFVGLILFIPIKK